MAIIWYKVIQISLKSSLKNPLPTITNGNRIISDRFLCTIEIDNANKAAFSLKINNYFISIVNAKKRGQKLT
jgi:hypothetical protein